MKMQISDVGILPISNDFICYIFIKVTTTTKSVRKCLPRESGGRPREERTARVVLTEDPAGPEGSRIPLRSCSGDRSLCSENSRTSTSGGGITRYPLQCQGDTSVFLELDHSE